VQRALSAFYRDLAVHMPNDRIAVIDGSGSIDEVHARVWRTFNDVFPG
jgi:thymidylate kinase